MKFFPLVTLLTLVIAIVSCESIGKYAETETENEAQDGGYHQYYESTRRAALGEDWERITQENTEKASLSRLNPAKTAFAGGALAGDWYERGSSTVAGSIVATVFYPSTEEIYAISERGVLLKGGLTGSAWTILNDVFPLDPNGLAVVANGGGKRIIAAKSDKKIYYSDDEGTTWNVSSGFSYSSTNGGPKKFLVLNNGILYYLVHASSSTYRLYRSADNGASWSNIQTFDPSTSGKTDMWSPFGTDELYVLHNGTSLYKLSGTETALTLLNTNATIPTNVDYSLTGSKNGAALTLYVLAADANLYKSTDDGATWANIATLTTNAWSVGMVANPWVADALYYGAINFYKSTTPTPSFTTQNVWGDYYDNIDLLHADMMSIKPYQKTDGTKFFLIGNHGGIHYFADPFTTTANLTKTGIRNADYYDVTTIDGTIFAGAQDQGNQRFSGSTGTNILTATQLTGGDYVRINSSVNNTKYWHEYPQTGASCPIRYYDSPLTQTNSTANTTIYGTSGTNMQYWIAPICNWSVAAENSILIGGGGVASGATTSQVIKLTYDGSTIVKSAYPFDFKADGNGYISALEHSPANANYMYVGLNNGKFYYSSDAGATFTQTTSFTGPTNAHTHSTFIHASRVNANLAFFSGGGGHIYKTTNGGVAFTDMSTGLPNTFVSEMTLNTAETLLFAATDAGPYVCVLSTGQWYSMATATTPVMAFRAVEWIASTNTVRFATYGRGIWDFQITSQVLPISYKSFEVQGTDNQQVNIVWATETERDLTHFEIERSENGRDFKKIATVEARNKGSQYALIDKFPVLNAVNYYRIKSVELSGKTELTAVKSVLMNASKAFVQVYPTFLTKNSLLFIQSDAENRSFVLYDLQQRVVAQQKLVASGNQLTLPNLPEGIYFYTIQEANGQMVKTGQLRLL